MPTEWIVEQVHTPCVDCDRAASAAITTATATGSREASHSDSGNHAARVHRAEPGRARAALHRTGDRVWYCRYLADNRLSGPFRTRKAAQAAVDSANAVEVRS